MQEFKQLIEASHKILVTSHISPDPDAVCSALLLGRILRENYSDKDVSIVLEEKPGEDLNFLEGFDQLEFKPLLEKVSDYQPDLFIIVDGNNFGRISRTQAEGIRAKLAELQAKLAIIDHHEEGDKDESDVFINNKRPATAEEIYNLCFDQLQLKKPSNYAETALLGIVSDTQRHRFDHPGYRETYRIVSELLDDGASIEKLEVKLEHYDKDELEVISELAKNITNSGQGYTYSFVSDEFSRAFFGAHKNQQAIKDACDEFVNRYIRSFEDNKWGFIVYQELIEGQQKYGVTFRAVGGSKDVSEIARQLGGGGHKPAAGAKIEANTVDEAINKVKAAA